MLNVPFSYKKDHPTSPLIGHSFGCFKGKGFIYGGSSNDVVNELTNNCELQRS